MNNNLSAEALKTALWDTLNSVKTGTMQPGQADAIASQAREITRIVKVQCQIAAQSKRPLPSALLTFSENP